MATLPKEEAKILKAQIFDLTEDGAKQALYGKVQILEQSPFILLPAFRLLVEDGGKYSEVMKNRAAMSRPWFERERR